MDHRDRRHAVVVGFDDSAGSRHAVQWAAAEASARERALVIVHALDLHPAAGAHVRQPVLDPVDRPRRETAIRALSPLVTETRRSAPDLDVVATLSDTDATTAISDITAELDGALIVVGSSGHSALPRMLIGSTAADLVHAARQITVIVRGNENSATDGPVLVGVDGTDFTAKLFDFAFQHAAAHGNTVHAIHALGARWLGLVGPAFNPDRRAAPPGAATAEFARRHLDERRKRYPDVPATFDVVDDRPAQALVDRSDMASLVVVGNRRHGPIRRTVFGSVSHALLYHAKCPVAVVPS
ncbi:universal stress protein [Kibdelosporangium aridum]|nr:universal stress protein [Kibdelosporangium aridum]